MTSLFLNRMIVFKNGHRAYDESFHNGLNIIRGANGSGKSSIADLLFYGLGGELDAWKEHAALCDYVVLEIKASGKLLTLKREISETKLRPLQIFFGPMEDGLSVSADGWSSFPYTRTVSGHERTFSQVLFEALGIPEIPGDEGANITMHQILRLMYVDQTTPYQKIFRLQRMDPKNTRRAVAELLCGIGGRELYAKRIQYRELSTSFAEVRSKFSNLMIAAASVEEGLNILSIEAELSNLSKQKEALEREITEFQNSSELLQAEKKGEQARRKIQNEYKAIRHRVDKSERQLHSIDFEIRDGMHFIGHLESLLSQFDDSAETFVALGGIDFEYCPACLTPLKGHGADHCGLCGAEISEDEKSSKVLALKLDLEGQLQESLQIQKERVAKQEEIATEVTQLRRSLTRTQRQYEEFLELDSERSALISKKSRELGRLENRFDELSKLSRLAEKMNELAKEKETLNEKISRLGDEIHAIELAQEKRKREIYTEIAENTRSLLELDLKEHNDFENAKEFTFNFEDDWFAVNGNPNISTSASGMVVVKNSFFLSILMTSCSDERMSFPRFLLLDNVEDKGMVEERVQHFQATIADKSSNIKCEHQIIITTSTINETLNVEKYTVGDFYTKDNRTLKFI